MTDHKKSIEQRLNKHPHLKKRIEQFRGKLSSACFAFGEVESVT